MEGAVAPRQEAVGGIIPHSGLRDPTCTPALIISPSSLLTSVNVLHWTSLLSLHFVNVINNKEI